MKQFKIGNFFAFLLNAGSPDLARLGLSKNDYEQRCSQAGRPLDAFSFKLQFNGIGNPYDERSQMEEHQKFNLSKTVLPSHFEYFLEDEIDKRISELNVYLLSR